MKNHLSLTLAALSILFSAPAMATFCGQGSQSDVSSSCTCIGKNEKNDLTYRNGDWFLLNSKLESNQISVDCESVTDYEHWNGNTYEIKTIMSGFVYKDEGDTQYLVECTTNEFQSDKEPLSSPLPKCTK